MAPPLTVYSYVPDPPAAPLIVIVPSAAPLQFIFVLTTEAERTTGWVITTAGFRAITHPVLTASRILILNVPGARLVKLPDPCHDVPPLILYP